MSKVLIVDDDKQFAKQLKDLLSDSNMQIELAHCGKDGLQLLTNFQYSMVLLDWDLPDIDGIEICGQLRKKGNMVPIIFITGRNNVKFLEQAFNAGADDYIEKPVEGREVLARLRGLQRRLANQASTRLVHEKAHLDLRTRELKFQESVLVLTSMETELVEFLMRHPNEAFTAAELFKAAWPSETSSSYETVRVHVNVLRRKLALAGQKDFLKTIPGRGYTVGTEFNV